MAQIRIEKEPKNNSILPWILGLLLLAVGVYVVAEVLDEADEQILTEAEMNDVNEYGNRITDEEYDPNEENEGNFLADRVENDKSSYAPGPNGNGSLNYADDREDVDYTYRTKFATFMDYTKEMEGEMGLDHKFSHRAISMLAASASAVADGYGIDAGNPESKAKQAMRLADDITKDPYATNHADKIRMAALLITEILEDVDQQVYNGAGENNLSMLRKEAQAINSKTLTLNQKEDVRSFFRAARKVLSNMK